MKNKISAILIIVMVMGITGCSSTKTEKNNTNYSYSWATQTNYNPKISEEIFDILEHPLGFQLQENMQPISRKTWEYLINSDFTMYPVTNDNIKETFYENKNRTDALEIHQTDENYKVSVTTLIFKSINYTEVNLFREKIISMAEKKFESNSPEQNIEGSTRVFFPFTGTVSRFFIHPIVKANDENYIFIAQAHANSSPQTAQLQSSSEGLKIPDDIFDILRSPLGLPVQKNMLPQSRRTWEYSVVATTGTDLSYVKNVLKWDMSAGSYEKPNGTDILEIHSVDDDNKKVNSVNIVWKSKNFSEVDALQKKFIYMAEKKFGTAGNYQEDPNLPVKTLWWKDTNNKNIMYYVYSITKHEDGNYLLLVYSLYLNKLDMLHFLQEAFPDVDPSFF